VKSFCVFSLDDQHVWVASRIGAAMLLPAALPHQLRINPALMWQKFNFFLTTGQKLKQKNLIFLDFGLLK
jgi:hypothetical protein